MKDNSFSKHDNRHIIENFGIYLGGGLGRKQQTDPQKSQHRSDSQLYMHSGTSQQKFISTYASGYRLKFIQEGMQDRCSSAIEGGTAYSRSTGKDKELTNTYRIGSTKETFRRFPHRYSLPKNKESARPSINTIWWYSSSPDRASAHGTGPPSNSGEHKAKRNESRRTLGHSATAKQHNHKGAVTWKY